MRVAFFFCNIKVRLFPNDYEDMRIS